VPDTARGSKILVYVWFAKRRQDFGAVVVVRRGDGMD
jgi:hypothetical protein